MPAPVAPKLKPARRLPGARPARVVSSPIRDYLLGGGMPPSVDPRREYLASGGRSFPLVGQVELSRGIDDLTRDLGPHVYEMMLNDPTVASGFWTLATGILAGQFQVTPAIVAEEGEEIDPASDRAGDIQLALEVAQFCRRQVDRLNKPVKQLSAEFLLGMAYGSKLAEKTLEAGSGEDKGAMVLRSIRFKRNASWAYIVDPLGDVVAIRGLQVGGTLVDMPATKFMIFSWLPQDNDPRGRSILRAAYNGWNLKINTWPKLFKYLDKFGTPTVVGVASPDAPDEPAVDENGNPTGEMWVPTEAMFHMLGRLESGSVAAVRAGSDIKLIQAQGEGQAFAAALQIFKHEILEGILLSARATMEAKNSSKADSESAQDVVGQLLSLGREALENLYEDQLFHWLIEINWGKDIADRFTPDVSFGGVEDKDVATVLTSYTQAGYQFDPSAFPLIDARIGIPPRKAQVVTEQGDPRHVSEVPNEEGEI